MTQAMKTYLLLSALGLGLHGFGGAFGWFKNVDPVSGITRGMRSGAGGAFRGGK